MSARNLTISKKRMTLVTRILFILLSALPIHGVSAAPLNSKNVAVYRDEQSRFILSYPSSWTHVPSTHQRTRIKIVSEEGAGGEDCAVNVQELEDGNNLSPAEAIRSLPDARNYEHALRTALPNAKVVRSGKTHLSNQEAEFFVTTFTVRSVGMEVPMKSIVVQTIRNDKLYTASCRSSPERFEELMPIFQLVFAGLLIK